MTINTTAQAVSKANSITTGYAGMCLLFVQTCYNAQARYSSAWNAWIASKHKHETTDVSKIPVGAPIWFKPLGNPYGHVAINLGNGYMRTTNSATKRVETDKISTWQHWGYQLVGYTTDIEDQAIPDLQDTSSKTTDTKTTTIDDIESMINNMKATHIVFQYKNALGIINVLANTYHIYASPTEMDNNIYILKKCGAKVLGWKDVNGGTNLIRNIGALGTKI